MKISDDAGEDFHDEARRLVAEIRDTCDGIIRYEYGANVAARANGYNYVIFSLFTDEAAHDVYQVSDIHVKLATHMAQKMEDILACDFEIPDEVK
ncbi:MAG: Dabb family protein [Fimbriimonadaceae bacterium]|nr:Dabb family protein [Alphaproteobacteria bacterium]